MALCRVAYWRKYGVNYKYIALFGVNMAQKIDADEREAIRKQLADSSVNVLRWYGSDPWVALVDRDAPTEYTNEGERVVLVEWFDEDDAPYSISTAEGTFDGWELLEAPHSTFESRDEAVAAAIKEFKK